MKISQTDLATKLQQTAEYLLTVNHFNNPGQFVRFIRYRNKGFTKADGRDYNGGGQWTSPIQVLLEGVCDKWNEEGYGDRVWYPGLIRSKMNAWKDETFELLKRFAHLFLSKMHGRIKKGTTDLFKKVFYKLQNHNFRNNKYKKGSKILKSEDKKKNFYWKSLKKELDRSYTMIDSVIKPKWFIGV